MTNVKFDILVKTILNFVIITIATPTFALFQSELGMRTNLGRLCQVCSTLRCILLKVIYTVGIIYLRLQFIRESNLSSFFTQETSFCTTKAARRLAESQWFTTKLWNKGVASMRWIRSNETQEKARNLTNCKYFDALSFTANNLRSLFGSLF